MHASLLLNGVLHMKNLRLLAIGSLSVVLFASGVLVACSDDTTNPTGDAGGPDGFVPPTTDGGDGGGPDAADAAPDVLDAGFVLTTFPEQLATAICKSLSRCCYGNANLDAGSPVDGGTYDQAGCIDTYRRNGWDTSNFNTASALDAGAIALDQAKALDCITKVSALTCDLPSSEYDMINAACFAAYKGKIANGAACQSSLECGSTSFCQRATSASAGTCAPLRAAGDSCGDFITDPTDLNLGDEACSYRASGIPDSHCDSIAAFDGPTYKPLADWKCVANLDVGSSCANTNWCASGICTIDHVCADPYKYFDSTCSSYVTP